MKNTACLQPPFGIAVDACMALPEIQHFSVKPSEPYLLLVFLQFTGLKNFCQNFMADRQRELWLSLGHGRYDETDEKGFLRMHKDSPLMVTSGTHLLPACCAPKCRRAYKCESSCCSLHIVCNIVKIMVCLFDVAPLD